MDRDQQTSNVPQSDERFMAVLDELTRIKDEFVVRQLNWYAAHGRMPMVFFRISGVLVILLSVSLPFLATLEGFWKNIVLPIIALVIAGLTGLNSFFRWESDWKGYRQTQYALRYLLMALELQITEAKHQVDMQKGIDMAVQATRQLIDKTQTTTSTEAEEYFKRVQMPRTQQS
jgi:hypothetical protein